MDIVCGCGSENAYFNGTCYECPDCGRTWGCIEDDTEDDNYDDYDDY